MQSWRRDGDMAWLGFPSLEEAGAVAAFSSRQGGISSFPYVSLNLAYHTGDHRPKVMKNRLSLLAALGLESRSAVSAEQVHGNRVVEITTAPPQEGGAGEICFFPDCDALITSLGNVCLVAYFADCVPLYFLDPDHQAIGLAHAGWRGTVEGIAIKTLEAMRHSYGTKPAACWVVIGPAIGACCYQVGAEVVEGLFAVLPDLRGIVLEEGNDFRLDLKAANARMLLEAGVEPSRLTVSSYCTSCRPDLFYSFRRDGATGRMAAVLGRNVSNFMKEKQGIW